MKKVSVIIPAYNAELYLSECLKSVCRQTYSELEIIVVDDGSKDKTKSIIEEAAEKDSRIRFFCNENHGVSYSRNYAIERSNGDYITFVDSDDIVARDFVQELVENIEVENADMAALAVVKSKEYQENCFTNGGSIIYSGTEMFEQLFGIYEGFVCNKLYRTSLLQTYGICLEKNIALCEDLLFNVEYLMHCEKVVYNSGKKYFYRQSEASAQNRLNNVKWFDMLVAYDRVINLLKEFGYECNRAQYLYKMALFEAKYRLRFVPELREKIAPYFCGQLELISILKCNISFQETIRLLLFKFFPNVIMAYKRRRLR